MIAWRLLSRFARTVLRPAEGRRTRPQLQRRATSSVDTTIEIRVFRV